jgi:hypothetical protein
MNNYDIWRIIHNACGSDISSRITDDMVEEISRNLFKVEKKCPVHEHKCPEISAFKSCTGISDEARDIIRSI